MLRMLPTRAWIWAVMSAFALGFLALIRKDAKREQRRAAKLKDYEHAEDIETRVSRSRADPERLRKYEGIGYRD